MRVKKLCLVVAALVCVCLMLSVAGCGLLAMGGRMFTGAFSGQQEQAEDAATKSLVRNSMTAIESAYVDTRTFDSSVMTPDMLVMIEPSIEFNDVSSAAEAIEPTASALEDTVDYYGKGDTYAVGSVSGSGTSFSVSVQKGPNGGNSFYIDAQEGSW